MNSTYPDWARQMMGEMRCLGWTNKLLATKMGYSTQYLWRVMREDRVSEDHIAKLKSEWEKIVCQESEMGSGLPWRKSANGSPQN